MKKLLVFLCAIALVFTMAGSASAIPIDFNIAGDSNSYDIPYSSVTLDNISTWPSGWTSISAEIVAGLDDEFFFLGDGGSYTFDFFQVTVDGLGLGSADVEATLAFEEPSGLEVTGTGTGGWFTVCGFISGGYLSWAYMPQTFTLVNGDYFDVDFEDVLIAGLGNRTTVSATVTAHAAPVPEPSTVMLVGTGLLGMIAFGRKRFNKKA
ncbi:MAG: PEP-CTERM sorting domain-containing protein [Desulfobacteraceae bacterium]|nr:PEP-CTERM sorting domain-containing protein [Desulfobacteraceae bacterium]